MLQGVLAATHIQGIAVGQKGDAAQLLYHIGHCLGIVRPQEAQVARLPEVQLDGDKLLLHVDIADSRCADQPLQLFGEIVSVTGSQVGIIHFCWVHGGPSLFWLPALFYRSFPLLSKGFCGAAGGGFFFSAGLCRGMAPARRAPRLRRGRRGFARRPCGASPSSKSFLFPQVLLTPSVQA